MQLNEAAHGQRLMGGRSSYYGKIGLGGGLPRHGGTYTTPTHADASALPGSSLPGSSLSGFDGPQQSLSLPVIDPRFQTLSIGAACQHWLMPVKGQRHLRAPTVHIVKTLRPSAHPAVPRLPPLRGI